MLRYISILRSAFLLALIYAFVGEVLVAGAQSSSTKGSSTTSSSVTVSTGFGTTQTKGSGTSVTGSTGTSSSTMLSSTSSIMNTTSTAFTTTSTSGKKICPSNTSVIPSYNNAVISETQTGTEECAEDPCPTGTTDCKAFGIKVCCKPGEVCVGDGTKPLCRIGPLIECPKPSTLCSTALNDVCCDSGQTCGRDIFFRATCSTQKCADDEYACSIQTDQPPEMEIPIDLGNNMNINSRCCKFGQNCSFDGSRNGKTKESLRATCENPDNPPCQAPKKVCWGNGAYWIECVLPGSIFESAVTDICYERTAYACCNAEDSCGAANNEEGGYGFCIPPSSSSK